MTATPQNLSETPHLSAALEQLRLEGAIFFRFEFTENWGFESAPTEAAGMIRPGAERLFYFHIVAEGECWTSVDGERHWAKKGDVIVLPYGHQHYMGGTEPAEAVSIMTLIDSPPPWKTLPCCTSVPAALGQTSSVAGSHSEDPLFDPAMSALPPLFVVRPEGPAAQWVDSSVEYALAASEGAELPSTRLPELLVSEILRMHLSSVPGSDHGWIAALRDPVLAPALALLHSKPDEKWTVADLASSASVSRSLLDERFRQVLGRPPIRYLTDWRMHMAKGMLASTDLSVSQVATRVGYESVEAFSRAFKRQHGRPPSALRS